MPITQDRLIALLDIAETQQNWRSNLAEFAKRELEAATTDFYKDIHSTNEYSHQILAHLQSLVAAIIDSPPLSEAALTTLVREREHFHHRRGSNARAARSMARKRGAA